MLSEQGFGAPSVAQNRALALTDRSGGNLVPGAPNYLEGEFSVVHPDLAISGSSPSAIAGSDMPRFGAAGAPMADIASGPGAYSAMPMRPIIAGATIGTPILATAISNAQHPVPTAQPVTERPNAVASHPNLPIMAQGNQYGFPQGLRDEPVAVTTAKHTMPVRPPIDLTMGNKSTPSGGGLASLFNQPLSTKQLNQQSIDNPDDPGAWMRAERQYAATHKDNPNFDVTKLDTDTGMNRGGTASGKSGKVPDPVHKALEIIHHLLMRQ
jgi:hypothetical protein